MKDYLEEHGVAGNIGSKNATREAFKNGLIGDGEAWMAMINARNLTSYTYITAISEGIAKDILAQFHPAFVEIEKRFSLLCGQESDAV